jgi:putative two-component system response regulator
MTHANGSTKHPRVLVIDDDQQTTRMLGRVLERAGYEWTAVTTAEEASAELRNGAFPLALSGLETPGERSLEQVRQLLLNHPDVAVVMVSAIDDPEFARTALEFGAYGYIIKPFTPSELEIAVANALRRRTLEIENKAQRQALEQIVKVRTAALERSAHQLKLTREETVRRLSRAVEYRDEETGNHTERMSRYCALMARRTGLDPESLRIASALHDVGKVAVPDHVLLKPGILNDDERHEMERHTTVGYRILSGSGSSLLELGALIAWTHHEKFDGSGYPRALAGHDIPIEGRIAAVADVFDALTTHRQYRSAFSLDHALAIMHDERGKHFDADLVDFFIGSMDEVAEIRRAYADDSREPAVSV